MLEVSVRNFRHRNEGVLLGRAVDLRQLRRSQTAPTFDKPMIHQIRSTHRRPANQPGTPGRGQRRLLPNCVEAVGLTAQRFRLSHFGDGRAAGSGNRPGPGAIFGHPASLGHGGRPPQHVVPPLFPAVRQLLPQGLVRLESLLDDVLDLLTVLRAVHQRLQHSRKANQLRPYPNACSAMTAPYDKGLCSRECQSLCRCVARWRSSSVQLGDRLASPSPGLPTVDALAPIHCHRGRSWRVEHLARAQDHLIAIDRGSMDDTFVLELHSPTRHASQRASDVSALFPSRRRSARLNRLGRRGRLRGRTSGWGRPGSCSIEHGVYLVDWLRSGRAGAISY